MLSFHSSSRGTTLIELIVAIGIMMLIFTALFSAFQSSLVFSIRNRMHTQARLIANEQFETIRALPYDTIGTVLGIPSGTIPQLQTITREGVPYTLRTFIQYVDDPADGLDVADTLSADYKRIKIEVSYPYNDTTLSFSAVTTVAPKSQESLAGAGILRIVVTDALNNPLPSATVHVVNASVNPQVDVSTFTNLQGIVSFPGAWAGAGYSIVVNKAGYSTAQTYTASSTNPNPSPSPVTVAENTTSEIYLKIDRLSKLNLTTQAWPLYGALNDTFSDATQLSTLASTTVSGGTLALTQTAGAYDLAGSATSLSVSPASLGQWLSFSFTDTKPANTTLYYQFLYDSGAGVFVPIPESDLAGNTTGFTTSPIDLHTLSTSTYTTLRVHTSLSTADQSVSPTIADWHLSYEASPALVADVPVTIRGTKTIGALADGTQVLKYNASPQTSAEGTLTIPNLEWDEYTLAPQGYTVANACPTLPLSLDPDTTANQTLFLATPSAHTLTVQVLDASGVPIPRSEVRVEHGGVATTRATSLCGVAFFPSLTANTYTVSVLSLGHGTDSASVAVSGATTHTFTF